MNTKYGNFEVKDNNNGGAILSMNGVDIIQFPKTAWWNVDGLLKEVEKNGELIEKRLSQRVTTTTPQVNESNVKETLEELMVVLGDKEKGFFKSRLKQCMNKLG